MGRDVEHHNPSNFWYRCISEKGDINTPVFKKSHQNKDKLLYRREENTF